MAELYYFFNSTPEDERWYEAQHFSSYFGSLLSSGIISNELTDELMVDVVEGTMSVKISKGKALIKGHFYENTSDIVKELDSSEANKERIDRVVLRLDLSQEERSVKVNVLKGGKEGTPPTLTRSDVIYELSLAQILVRKDTVQLLEDDLKDERLIEELCGLVQVLSDLPTTKFQEQWDDFMSSVKDEGYATLKMLDDHISNKDIHKTSEEIRSDSTTELRAEVVSSLPQEAYRGQIVLDTGDGLPKFKGFDGGKWV